MLRTTVAGALLALALAGCTPKESPVTAASAVDTAAVLAAVDDVWSRWSAADVAGDLDALIGLSTEDVRFDATGLPPLIGHDAARAAWAQVFAGTDYTEASINPTYSVAVTNELAHSGGSYFSRFTAAGKPGAEYGRYVAALVKGADGRWRVAYIMALLDSTVTSR